MTPHDYLLPAAEKIIRNLAGKPGIHFADRKIAADFLAQGLHRMLSRGEIGANKTSDRTTTNQGNDAL